MPYYNRIGSVPPKRHTQFRKPDGGLYAEQLFSTEGFSSDYTLLYHLHPPTQVVRTGNVHPVAPVAAGEQMLAHRCFDGFRLAPAKDYLTSRIPLLFNHDLEIQLAAPQTGIETSFYKNVDADELIFVHRGSGVLKTPYGSVIFGYGDYLVIPRGTIYQINFYDEDNRLLIVESRSPIRFPKRYVSPYGQLLEHAPFCERDLRPPTQLKNYDERGEFLIKIKKQGRLHDLYYATHPFDVLGWDGCCYPFALSIFDFEPITGRVHQPPPVHQTFEARNFVVCSFVPRLFDYHADAIPVPYHHSNVDSDEVLYYVDGDFMSRKAITKGMMTLHPAGIPHGPHPGAFEKSIGATETRELAVMIDTFHPLMLTEQALGIEETDYIKSWLMQE